MGDYDFLWKKSREKLDLNVKCNGKGSRENRNVENVIVVPTISLLHCETATTIFFGLRTDELTIKRFNT